MFIRIKNDKLSSVFFKQSQNSDTNSDNERSRRLFATTKKCSVLFILCRIFTSALKFKYL